MRNSLVFIHVLRTIIRGVPREAVGVELNGIREENLQDLKGIEVVGWSGSHIIHIFTGRKSLKRVHTIVQHVTCQMASSFVQEHIQNEFTNYVSSANEVQPTLTITLV